MPMRPWGQRPRMRRSLIPMTQTVQAQKKTPRSNERGASILQKSKA